MFRLTTLKISLLSAFATLFLLIAMLASTGTASAHTQDRYASDRAPRLSAFNTMPPVGNCESMTAKGFYFSLGSATLTATQKGSPLTVTPNVFNVTAADGVFSSEITICGIVFGSPQANVYLIGIDSNGVQTNQVLIDLIN